MPDSQGGPRPDGGHSAPTQVTRPPTDQGPFDRDKFTELGVLGRGGSSLVVRALDNDFFREVAIKILSSESLDGSPEAARFLQEARVTGQLEHPNIVPIYEMGARSNGQRFLCLRMLEGQTLEATLKQLGDTRLQPDNLANLLGAFVKVCDAVAFAHSRGVIHRDIKPLNIMLSDFGQVYLLDWGIARLLGRAREGAPGIRLSLEETPGENETSGTLVGTPSYMAPEQIVGPRDAVDERTDVFALGATLYQILAGVPPMTPDLLRSIWMQQSPSPIKPPEEMESAVPAELWRIATRALEFERTRRYASVVDLKQDIEQFLRGAWHLQRQSFAKGTVVVREGEPGHAAYVIEQGQCAVYRTEGGDDIELRVMGRHEVFGETAIFSDKPRTASVKALTDVVLLVVTSEVLGRAVGLNSWMGAFVKALAERFREVDEKLSVAERRLRTERP